MDRPLLIPRLDPDTPPRRSLHLPKRASSISSCGTTCLDTVVQKYTTCTSASDSTCLCAQASLIQNPWILCAYGTCSLSDYVADYNKLATACPNKFAATATTPSYGGVAYSTVAVTYGGVKQTLTLVNPTGAVVPSGSGTAGGSGGAVSLLPTATSGSSSSSSSSPSTSSSGPSTGVIVGAAVGGGVAGLAILAGLLVLVFYMGRRKTNSDKDGRRHDPHDPSTGTVTALLPRQGRGQAGVCFKPETPATAVSEVHSDPVSSFGPSPVSSAAAQSQAVSPLDASSMHEMALNPVSVPEMGGGWHQRAELHAAEGDYQRPYEMGAGGYSRTSGVSELR